MPRHHPTRPPSRARLLAPAFSRLSVGLALLLAGALAAPADGPYTYVPTDAAPPATAPAALPALPGTFVTALAGDPQGRVIVATEGAGVWRQEPTSGQYAHFTAEDTHNGLACDDVYALAVDKKQRLWAGTRAGLSVYNGLAWRTYGPAEGLAGSRVSALAVCPTDGDVWAATEGGLTRYSLHRDTWRTYSRADGLPSDALSCLAFDRAGNLYVGTQADGVAVSSREDDYRAWRVTRGPARMPALPDGRGLPSSLVNCLLVSRDGSVYAGTDGGLARSKDGGRRWRFLRGVDWADLVKGQRGGPRPEETWDPGDRMSETYVTALGEVWPGRLLVGHRRTGLDVFQEATGRSLPPGASSLSVPGTDYVTAVLARPGGAAAVGFYGGGLATVVGQDAGQGPRPAPPLPFRRLPPLPSPAAPPTLARLNALLRAALAVPADPGEYRPHALALADDWQTRGDWLGRYGRYWACLFALFHPIPADYLWGAGWEPVDYDALIGPQHDRGDSLRYWLEWRYTDDPRVLEMPPTYLHSRVLKGYTTWDVGRRETEIDDHGEAYPWERAGPDVYLCLTVPPGLYALSLYDVNKDGHQLASTDSHGPNDRVRDYRLSVRPCAVHSEAQAAATFGRAPEWARGRVVGFWGGVWKRFLVRGPVTLTVQVERNYSFDTILPAAALDLVDETPPPYFGTVTQWQMAQTRQEHQWRSLSERNCPAARFSPARTEAEAASRLYEALARAQSVNSAWWAKDGRRFYAPLLRWYAAQASAKSSPLLWRHLATCDYQLGLYPPWEQCQREAGLTPARDVEQSLRWDAVTASNSGRGYEVVTQHLADQKAKQTVDVQDVKDGETARTPRDP